MIMASLLAMTGCRTERAIRNVADGLIAQPDPTVELLESELRWMEDNIYRLDDQLDATLRQLDSTRRNNAALRLELAQRQQTHSTGQVINGPIISGQPIRPDSTSGTQDDGEYDEEKAAKDESLYDLSSPTIDLGDEANGNGEGNGSTSQDGSDENELPEGTNGAPNFQKPESILKQREAVKPRIELPDNPFKDDESLSPFLNEQDNPNEVSAPPAEINQVSRIRLNQRLTGGYSFDGKTGHDGVMVILEPQDAYARYAAVAGPVTVEVRDPSKPGVVGQIGKWSFTEAEVYPRLKQTLMGKGIHLELPWPNGSPTAKELELLVEYETPQGKKLVARQPLHINPTTSALVNQADAAEQGFIQQPTISASRWKPTR